MQMSVRDARRARILARPQRFRVIVRHSAHTTVIDVHGELDLATAPSLQRALDEQRGRVVVDLRHVTFIDVSALRVLLAATRRAHRDGLDLRIAAGRVAQRLLDLIRTDASFGHAKPDDAAFVAFDGSSRDLDGREARAGVSVRAG